MDRIQRPEQLFDFSAGSHASADLAAETAPLPLPASGCAG